MLEKINSGLQKTSFRKKRSGYLMTVNSKELLHVSLFIFLIRLYYFLNPHHHQLILFTNVSQKNLFPFCLSSWVFPSFNMYFPIYSSSGVLSLIQLSG